MSDQSLVGVRDLTVSFPGSQDPAVSGVSFDLQAGECLALIGESGSGKTLTALSLLGLAPQDAVVDVASMIIAGEQTKNYRPAQWRALRGNTVAVVSQDAAVSLDPLRRVEHEVGEAVSLARPTLRADEIAGRVDQALALAAMPDATERKKQYPHELSGGLRQRALIASALAGAPRILIADEPTTALDSLTQERILALLATLKQAGTALLLVTHDVGVVRNLADRIAVMRDGRIIESGKAEKTFTAPQQPYTQRMVAARNAMARPSSLSPGSSGSVLECRGLTRIYPAKDGSPVQALSQVSCLVTAGQTLGIVGESGSGKSTLARIMMGLEAPDQGDVLLMGEPWSALPEKVRRARRGRIQLIEQNPWDALDPRWSVRRILSEAIALEPAPGGRSARAARSRELLEQVGLPEELLDRRAHQLSGGQRQRVVIARALARHPDILICDEPVSALDAPIQARVLELLATLQARLGMAIVLVSHDLGVVARYCHDVMVMRDGAVIESGPTQKIVKNPGEPFTRELLRASAVDLA